MRSSVWLLFVLSTSAALADDDPCMKSGWDLVRELTLLRESAITVQALPAPAADAHAAALDRRLEVKLQPSSTVKLLAKPRQEPAADSYSGLLPLRVPRSSTYRISAGQRMWVEVIGPDGPVKSSKFANAPNCAVLHKSVAFPLQPDTAYWIQLSGSAKADAVLVVTLER